MSTNILSLTPDAPVAAPEPIVVTRNMVRQLGAELKQSFGQFKTDRGPAELKWLRNLRQTLGILDPELEAALDPGRSRAFPRVTRVKVISTLSRIMNLMFNGTERNYVIGASPSAEMAPEDVLEAMRQLGEKYKKEGATPTIDEKFVQLATQMLADERAAELMTIIDDQLQELGGDQSSSYVTLSRQAALSGIMYSLGALRGPYARPVQRTVWRIDPATQQPFPQTVTRFKPMFDFLSVWDFYPDMSTRSLQRQDGYFYRLVMSRAQVSDLKKRADYFGEVVDEYLRIHSEGNWQEQPFESQLRSMGLASNTNLNRRDKTKYEVVVWCGPISGQRLREAGVPVTDEQLTDYINAEVHMIDDYVIKADINQYEKLGKKVKQIHTFLFEEDDTSPIGTGLPDIIRDSVMTVGSSMRALLDNASVVCGPIVEVNTDLADLDRDVSTIQAYDVLYRSGKGADAASPAFRALEINGHLNELAAIVKMGLEMADMESFVSPMGDTNRPSEPMRTVPGASMAYSTEALPFKDIVRNFDVLVESVIGSMVTFNEIFNPEVSKGDYNIISRGATSLIAKEVRAVQIDQLATTLTDEDKDYIDPAKFVKARFEVRDLGDMLAPPEMVEIRKQARSQQAQMQQKMLMDAAKAELRKTLAEAMKNVTQSQKNSANAEATTATTALKILIDSLGGEGGEGEGAAPSPAAPALRAIAGTAA